ncbi:hypothetical protein DOM22_05465 [Bdellovibrio sp. ZAP7]|nr:hypothetical protein DOM22_05465 [Bdellovibrio sp. ZAP7]
MNLTNLILWSAGFITALAGVQNIDTIQRGILKAQARLVYESRTETWGSPKFLKISNSHSVSESKKVPKRN